jgi:hypothetical protein
VHKEVQENMKSELEGKAAVILQDGWSTNQNKPVISHCLHTWKKAYFIDAESTGSSKKTPSTVLNCWKKQFNEVKKSFFVK